MILRRDLSQQDRQFNADWKAPLGSQGLKAQAVCRVADRSKSIALRARALGPFGFQPDNNATRVAEYPWAVRAVPVKPGQTVVDVGGSLCGLQFVLAKQGARVVNVDPSENASMGWPVSRDTFDTLNRCFRTDVELRKQFLQDAGFARESVDTIYCISTVEHIPVDQIAPLLNEMWRILRSGGHVVMTVDLFFDLAPFTSTERNIHGTNIDIQKMISPLEWSLVSGDRSELYGFPEFDPSNVLGRAMEFYQGDIALNCAQSLILRKQ